MPVHLQGWPRVICTHRAAASFWATPTFRSLQLRGDGTLTPVSDLYAVGVTLYNLFSRCFEALLGPTGRQRVLENNRALGRALAAPGGCGALAAVIQGCLAKTPRYRTIRLRTALCRSAALTAAFSAAVAATAIDKESLCLSAC